MKIAPTICLPALFLVKHHTMPHISALAARRAFSTTARRLVVAPESPKFIEVPTVELPRTFKPRRQKGILPEPKNLFPRKQPNKGTPEYLEAATKERTRVRHTPTEAETRAFQEWNTAMAEKRRQNLREGLTQLKQQKEEQEAKKAFILKQRNEERNAALNQAEREDVRLTLPSVLSTLRHEPKGLPDPNREERLAAMQQRREALEAEQKEHIREMVHELYMSAGDFIVTEQQLDVAIDDAFGEGIYAGDVASKQLSIRDMLEEKNRSGRNNMMGIFREKGISDVAGALTGGRLPPRTRM
ncbi:hypothetical protein EDC01DRAFT_643881, partial [Geopyxis carbonaria]